MPAVKKKYRYYFYSLDQSFLFVMRKIESIDNQYIKKVASLKEKKYRDELFAYIAEGIRWVTDAIAKDSSLVESVVVKNSCINEYKDLIRLDEEKIIVVADSIYNRLSDMKNNQGILAVLKILPKKPNLTAKNILFLDKLRDPGNLGTIIRSACATGFSEIICHNCVDIYNPKTTRSTMSALMNVNIYPSDYQILDKLSSTHQIIAADMGGENIFSIEPMPKNVCLIVGGEAQGVSNEVRKRANKIVGLPMQNIESLNAAVSASVLMYLLTNL